MQRCCNLAQKTELAFQAERQASVSTGWALRCPLLACFLSPSWLKLDINSKQHWSAHVVCLLSSLPSSQIRGVSVGLAACGLWRYNAGPTWTDRISRTHTYTHTFMCDYLPSNVLSCWEIGTRIILGSALFSFLRFSEDTSRQTDARGLHFPTSITQAHKWAQRWPRGPPQQWQ